MAVNLNYGLFALQPEAVINDSHRDGTIVLEYFDIDDFTVSTNLGTAEVPTTLSEVLGVIGLGFVSTFDTGDTIHGFSTDGVITTGAVTIRATTVSLADAAYRVRGFLVGKRIAETVLFNDPTD